MPDSKHIKWEAGLDTDGEPDPKAKNATLDSREPAANDADGWQQYRRWVSQAPTPRSRRSGIDPSLYTWKGYRDWSDQVKREWAKESDGDE